MTSSKHHCLLITFTDCRALPCVFFYFSKYELNACNIFYASVTIRMVPEAFCFQAVRFVNITVLVFVPIVSAIVFSERELMFTFAICRRPSVCRLSSVTFVHPTQAIEIFRNVSTLFGTLAICDPSVKILRRSSQGNPSVGGLNQRVVEKCSDFGPFQYYISEMVQDRRYVNINH